MGSPQSGNPSICFQLKLMINNTTIQSSLKVARINWNNWQDVFEHDGPVVSNPLFSEPGKRFGSFCKEYSVHRTIRSGKQNELRLLLVREFPSAIHDDSGKSLDELEEFIRPSFGTCDGTRRMRSVVSKIAAFLRPDRFVAWDTYARKGLNLILGRNPSAEFDSYASYLRSFDTVWQNDTGQRIRFYVDRNRLCQVEAEDRFKRRVLDIALMKCGNRKTLIA
jgi:hypothetical protein